MTSWKLVYDLIPIISRCEDNCLVFHISIMINEKVTQDTQGTHPALVWLVSLLRRLFLILMVMNVRKLKLGFSIGEMTESVS